MAKQATVFYKLPIEEMRGKLATKQDGIMYAGQEQGENTLSIGDGSHAATNFQKYIVVTKSRGKNRFYVKSRTTVANTTGTINTRAILALAMPLVDAIYARRNDAVAMVAFKEAYEYYKKNETLREYLTKVVIDSIRRNQANIVYLSKPNGAGLSEYVSLLENPYRSFNTDEVRIFTNGRIFGSLDREARVIQEYLQYRALQMSGSTKKIKLHDTISGSTNTIVVVTVGESPITDLNGTTQGQVFRLMEREGIITNITAYPFKLNYAISGQPYIDSAKTQTLQASTAIANITDLYI